MNISNLENKIEYKFTKIKYLEQALTHSSFNNQSNSYERLEFLGDRILGFIVAEEIFRNMPHIREGQMHLMCEFLINEENLFNVAQKLSLSNFIRVQSGNNQSEISNNKSIQSDVLEAIIAAIYLDGGLDVSKKFIKKYFDFLIKIPSQNSKSLLQERVLSNSSDLPIYTLIKKNGPDHNPEFLVKVEVYNDKKAFGKGNSLKEAEKNAASNLLILL